MIGQYSAGFGGFVVVILISMIKRAECIHLQLTTNKTHVKVSEKGLGQYFKISDHQENWQGEETQ